MSSINPTSTSFANTINKPSIQITRSIPMSYTDDSQIQYLFANAFVFVPAEIVSIPQSTSTKPCYIEISFTDLSGQFQTVQFNPTSYTPSIIPFFKDREGASFSATRLQLPTDLFNTDSSGGKTIYIPQVLTGDNANKNIDITKDLTFSFLYNTPTTKNNEFTFTFQLGNAVFKWGVNNG